MDHRVILDLCGGTGAWSDPYRQAGYEVWVLDPQAAFSMPVPRTLKLHASTPEKMGDVRLWPKPDVNVHGILAAPPCTHFSSSGARWWESKGDAALLEGLSVVDACLRMVMVTCPQWWALENPIGRLVRYLGEPRMRFDPCDYGDPWTKRTCLWGSFMIPERNRVEPTEGSKIHRMSPSPTRARERSRTPAGFARAFFEANP